MQEINNARLVKICDAQEGVSQKTGNPWRKVTAVFETSDNFPKTIAVTCFNSLCETVTAYTPGACLNVQFDVESRSWVNPNTNEERWFTEATARTIVPSVVHSMENFDKPIPPLTAPAPKKTEDKDGDLPF